MYRIKVFGILLFLFASIGISSGKDSDDYPSADEFRKRTKGLNSIKEVDRLQKEYLNKVWGYYREQNIKKDEKEKRGQKLGRIIADLHWIALDRKEEIRQEKADKMTNEELICLVEKGPLEDGLSAIRSIVRKNKPNLSPQIEKKLFEWCNHQKAEIRGLAVGGIGEFKNVPQPLKQVLIRLVSDSDEFVRMSAINSLWDIKPNEVAYCLIQALDDSFAEARTNAHIVLSKYDSNEFEKQQRIVNFLLETPNPGPRGVVYCLQTLFSVIGYFEFPCKIFHTHFFFSGLKNPWDP